MTRISAARVAAFAIGAALTSVSTRANAYVRYISDAGAPFGWTQSCVLITSFPSDFVTMMPLEDIEGATSGAASAWSRSGDPCTYLSITVTASMETAPRALNDGRNSLIFRTSSWCELGSNGACDPKLGASDPSALAVTSIFASVRSGQIDDADIEINGFNHLWADLRAHPELAANRNVQDLQNALTHEMGHLIGLDHTCWQPASNLPDPIDNTGNPLVDCDNASADVKATTMFPSATPGDTGKRDLAHDDQQAVCDIYPADRDPMVCMPQAADPSGCSCGVAGRPATFDLLTLTLAVFGVLWLRGRGRRGAEA